MGPLEFLTTLFGDNVSREHQLVLWRLSDKRSLWCDTIERAASVACEIGKSDDVYFGVSLQDPIAALAEATRRAQGQAVALDRVRGYASTARCIAGLHADMDVSGPKHKKPGLAPNVAAVVAALMRLPHKPTLVIATGGGIHAYWLFREMLMVEDGNAERIEALVAGWQAFVARSTGFTVDPTWDLARVLRLPGTVNTKHGNVVERIAFDPKLRFNPSDFEEWQAEPRRAVSIKVGEIELRDDAEPPATKLMTLSDLDAKFAATWNRRRTDLKSQSEHDMSLASIAARSGWTDQEIVDLIIAHRRLGNQDLKLRPDYYRATIAHARQGMVAEKVSTSISATLHAVESGGASPEDVRATGLRDLSSVLGLDVRRIVRFRSESDTTYRMETTIGAVDLGQVSTILSAHLFAQKVAALSGRVLGEFKAAQWRPIAQTILYAAEDQSLGTIATWGDQVHEWLVGYLAERPAAGRERAEAMRNRHPWIEPETGELFLFLSSLREWLRMRAGENLSQIEVGRRLRTMGALPHTVAFGSTTRSVWRIPAELASALHAGAVPRAVDADIDGNAAEKGAWG